MADEINYNEARDTLARLRNLLRVVEHGDSALEAAEIAQGIVSSLEPKNAEIQIRHQEANEKLADTETRLAKVRNDLVNANALLESIREEVERRSQLATKASAELDRRHMDRVAELEKKAQDEYRRRTEEFNRLFQQERTDRERDIAKIRAEQQAEQQKLENIRTMLKQAAQSAAQAAGV